MADEISLSSLQLAITRIGDKIDNLAAAFQEYRADDKKWKADMERRVGANELEIRELKVRETTHAGINAAYATAIGILSAFFGFKQ